MSTTDLPKTGANMHACAVKTSTGGDSVWDDLIEELPRTGTTVSLR
jgi:hypothetical protein